MIARGFKSVIWVATVGGAALCCYMVSLRVATERADLARVEGQIVAAKRDLRSLQTELGTRGRLTQLEQWNSDVLALAAPTSAQFVNDQVTLARLERHDRTVEEQGANIRLASAETPAPVSASAPAAAPAAARPEPAPKLIHAIAPAPAQPPMVHRASYTPAAVAAEAKVKAPAAAAPALPDKPKVEAEAAAPKKAKAAVIATAEPTKPTTVKPTTVKPATVKPAAPRTVTASAKPVTVPAKPAPAKPASAKAAPAKPAAATASRGLKAPGGEGHR
jgi:hypothetical protein